MPGKEYFVEFFQIFDFYSDASLARKMYNLSRLDFVASSKGVSAPDK